MAYGFDIAMGLAPRSNNPFGNNQTLDWTQIAPGFSPDVEGGMAVQQPFMSYPTLPPPPIPGMPRQQMAFSPAQATPVVSPATAAAAPVQPGEEKKEDIGDWEPTQAFELPDKKWTVRSFTPGQPAQVEKPGLGLFTIDPKQPSYANIQNRYNNLLSLYEQSRAKEATPEGQPDQQQLQFPDRYPMRINLGGQTVYGRYNPEDKGLYIDFGPEEGEQKYEDWTNIPEKDFSFKLDPATGKPMNQDYMALKGTLGSSLRDQAKNLNQYVNMDYKSAPTQSLMYKDLKYKITGGDNDTTPTFEFYWDGPGPAPKGLVEQANKNIANMLKQTETYAAEYDRVTGLKSMGLVDKFIQEKNQEIAGYESEKQKAEEELKAAEAGGKKKEIQDAKTRVSNIQGNINAAIRLRDKAESTRTFNVDGGTIIEELPNQFAAQVDPKKWSGRLALASGLGYTNPQQKQDEAQPVLDNDAFAKIAAADAVLATDVAPVGVDVAQFRKTVAPTVERLNIINQNGLDEHGAKWDKMAENEPATFQYTDVYGQKQTVTKTLSQATQDLNSALKKTFDAISVGDGNAYMQATEELRKAGELFSGSITPPGGLDTVLPSKSELRMANLAGSFSYVNEDNALIPGTLAFGTLNRELTPPRMIYNPPARPTGGGRDRDRRFVSALPFIQVGADKGIKASGQSLTTYFTSPGIYEATASEINPGKAQLFGQKTMLNMLLKPGGADITEQDIKSVGETIDKLNQQAADPVRGKELREMSSRVLWQQLADVGIPLGTQSEFISDMQAVYAGSMTVNDFMAKYWSNDGGLTPTSTRGWDAWKKYTGSATASEMARKQGPQYLSKSKDVKGDGRPFDVVWESARNKIQDTAYLMRNLGGVAFNRPEKGYSHVIDPNNAPGREAHSFQMFVNPFKDETTQSPFTAFVSVNDETALPPIGTREQAAALASGKAPGVNEQYDVTGSLFLMNSPGYAGIYMPSIQRYLAGNPIANEINKLGQTYWQPDLRAGWSIRPSEDESTGYDAQSMRQIPTYLVESAILASMFPKNRIFARTK